MGITDLDLEWMCGDALNLTIILKNQNIAKISEVTLNFRVHE